MNNKVLRKSFDKTQYVIIVIRDGVQKYVSKGYKERHNFDYTIALNRAQKFNSEELAKRFIVNTGLSNVVNIFKMQYSLSINE